LHRDLLFVLCERDAKVLHHLLHDGVCSELDLPTTGRQADEIIHEVADEAHTHPHGLVDGTLDCEFAR
jgi:hypothetical protein